MIATNFKNFKIKVFNFIIIKPLSIRDLVDTQQLIFPLRVYYISVCKSKKKNRLPRTLVRVKNTHKKHSNIIFT